MTRGVNELLTLVNNGTIGVDDVSLAHLSSCMFNPDSEPPDIIIRTSGESRLSDFLLYQVLETELSFFSANKSSINLLRLM